MQNSIDTITASQSCRFIIAAQFPLGVLSVARVAVNAAGHDGWMVMILGGLLVIASKLIISLLCRRFEGASILDIDRQLFGKYIGTFLNLLWIAYLIFASIANFTFFLISMKLWFFKYTPSLLVAILLISPTIVLVSKGLKNVCRFDIILYLMLFITALLLIYGSTRLKVTMLLPVGEAGPLTILNGLKLVSFTYMGFELLLFIFPNISNKKYLTKHIWLCGTIITSFFTFTSIVTICVFGTQYTSLSLYPMTSLAKLVKFPIFERIDLYYYASWIPAMILCTNSYVFCTCDSIRRTFKIKKPLWVILAVSTVLIISSIMVKSVDVAEDLGNLGGSLSCGAGIAAPVIILLISIIFKKGGAKARKKCEP